MFLRRLVIVVGMVLVLTSAVLAQSEQRQPAKPIKPYVVTPAQSVTDIQKQLQSANKAQDIMGGPGLELRVAIQHEKNSSSPTAEVHDASDDVYYVLEGSANLTLGGTLESPKEIEQGEWRGPKIIGGEKVEITKGDLVVVPRGTPHHRSTLNKDFTMILIKVFEDPRPPVPKEPAKP